ncbi:chorismate-binding protein, partial [Pricia sp. S334]
MRKTISFRVSDIQDFKQKLLSWGQQFDEVAWLDGNGHRDPHGAFDAVLAVDGLTSLVTDFQNAFNDLKEYQGQLEDWIFGYFSYDLKNDVEQLTSENYDGLHFPDLYFFQPKKIIRIAGNTVDFVYLNMVDDEIEGDFEEITEIGPLGMDQVGQGYDQIQASDGAQTLVGNSTSNDIRIKLRTSKDDYFSRIKALLAHIHRGDIYEANFCQEFYAENTTIDVLKAFDKLNAISKAPFAAFLKIRDKFLMSASPERYLRKKSGIAISQPIKGTAKRSPDLETDAALKFNLQKDAKERSENIMIVDLVRNDLSKSAVKGSVRVPELCEVHSFA